MALPLLGVSPYRLQSPAPSTSLQTLVLSRRLPPQVPAAAFALCLTRPPCGPLRSKGHCPQDDASRLGPWVCPQPRSSLLGARGDTLCCRMVASAAAP